MIVDVLSYKKLTGDSSANEDDLTDVLADAQQDFEERTRRKYERDTYTEQVRLINLSKVYPLAVPLQSVSEPTDAFIDGNAILVPYRPGIDFEYPFFMYDDEPFMEITYVGGYTPDTMPRDIKRAIAQMAYFIMHPVIFPGLPVGVPSASVGNVSLSGMAGKSLNGFGYISDDVQNTIDKYRRRIVL